MLNKLKELSKDTLVYGVSTIVGKFFNFVLVPFYTQVFPTDEFGVFGYFYSFQAFLNIAIIYGMDVAYLKFASKCDESEKHKWYSTAFLAIFITTTLFTASMFFARAPIVQLMEGTIKHQHIIAYLSGILFFDVICQIPFADLRLKRKTVRFATIKLINILVNIAMNLILILVLKMGIEAIFISNLIASGIMFLLLIPDILKNTRLIIVKDYLKKLFVFGIPYLPASLAAMIVQVIDRPLLRYMTDESTLGIYQANYKLGIFMMLVVSMFQYAWQPFFLINAKEKNAKEIFSKVLTLFVLAAGSIWIVLTLFIEDFARIEIFGKTIIGENYLGGLVIVPIILLGYLFNGMYVNFSAGVYIEEKTQYYPIVTGAGALVNVVVNLLLIPVWGILGAALATLASYIVMAGGLFVVSQKFYKIKYEYSKISILMTIIFATGGIYYYLYFINELNLAYKFFILAMFFLLLILLRVIRLDEIKSVTRALVKRQS